MEDRLRPKNPPVLPKVSPLVVERQSELPSKKRVVKKQGKKTCKTAKACSSKHSDYSDFEKTPPMFRRLDASGVRNPLILLDFVRWIVIPSNVRHEFTVPQTQKAFAETHGVTEDTLSNWKRLTGFWDEVSLHRNQEFRRLTSDVYWAVAQRAIRTGDPRAAELFAKLFEGYSEKVRIEDETPKELQPDEIEKVRHALYNIGLQNIITANKPDDEEAYKKAVLD